MNKFFKILIVAGFISSSLMASYTYKKAKKDDLNGIMQMYKKLTADDKHKLVIFPDKFMGDIFANAIAKGRIFVAQDSSGKTVSMLKLFFLYEEKEIQNILGNELCCLGEKGTLLDSGNIYANFKFSEDDPGVHFNYSNNNQNIYLYLGGEFTLVDYRKKGINSDLRSFALNSLKDSLKDKGLEQINVIYGLIDANQARTLNIVKQFLPYFKTMFDDKSLLYSKYFAYRAYKPEFIIENGGLIPVFKEKNSGRGSILSFGFGSVDYEV